jgi:hypothetical protein
VSWLADEPLPKRVSSADGWPCSSCAPGPERQQDRARSVLGKAARRLTLNAVGADAANAPLDETSPHSVIDGVRIAPPDNERTQRAGGALEDRGIALERPHRSVKAEGCERVTHPVEAGANVARSLQTGLGAHRAAEILARFSKCSRPTVGGNLPNQDADQVRQPPVWKLDSFELGRDAVDLGRASGSGPALATKTLQRHSEKSGLRQTIEAAAGNVAVDAQNGGDLGRGKRIALAARVEEHPAKLGIASRCKPVERHSGGKLPVGPPRKNQPGPTRVVTFRYRKGVD